MNDMNTDPLPIHETKTRAPVRRVYVSADAKALIVRSGDASQEVALVDIEGKPRFAGVSGHLAREGLARLLLDNVSIDAILDGSGIPARAMPAEKTAAEKKPRLSNLARAVALANAHATAATAEPKVKVSAFGKHTDEFAAILTAAEVHAAGLDKDTLRKAGKRKDVMIHLANIVGE